MDGSDDPWKRILEKTSSKNEDIVRILSRMAKKFEELQNMEKIKGKVGDNEQERSDHKDKLVDAASGFWKGWILTTDGFLSEKKIIQKR